MGSKPRSENARENILKKDKRKPKPSYVPWESQKNYAFNKE